MLVIVLLICSPHYGMAFRSNGLKVETGIFLIHISKVDDVFAVIYIHTCRISPTKTMLIIIQIENIQGTLKWLETIPTILFNYI